MGGTPWQFIDAVQGTNGANASVSTVKIAKTGGADVTFDAGAASNEKIAGDGFVEFTGCIQNSYRILGFSVDNPGVGRDEIDYGIYLRNDGFGVSFYENGAIIAHTNAAYGTTDVFRLERIGTTVRAYINGELKCTYPTTSTGSLLIDTSFFNTGGTFIGGIKLYDATSKSWRSLTWVSTNVTITVDTSATTRRLAFTAPTKMVAGDQLVAILASQGAEFVSASNATWTYLDTFYSATNRRAFNVYRRVVTADDPASFTFDLNVTQETLGALLVYRGLDNAVAAIGASSVDFSALTVGQLPVRTQTRLSDLYVGGVLMMTPGAVTVAPQSGATERIDFSQSALGVNTLRLEAVDRQANVVGNVGESVAFSGGSASGAAWSLLLQGSVVPLADVFTPLAPGAIGLPVEGI